MFYEISCEIAIKGVDLKIRQLVNRPLRYRHLIICKAEEHLVMEYFRLVSGRQRDDGLGFSTETDLAID